MELDRVVCADALEYLRTLPSESVDMVLTSPPYGKQRKYGGFTWNFEGIACELYRVIKSGCVTVWIVGDNTVDGSETLACFEQAIYFKRCAGFRVHDTMIWRKLVPGDMKKRYNHAFEYMFVLSKGTPSVFNGQLKRNKRAGALSGGGRLTSNGYVPQASTVSEWGLYENIWDIQGGNTGSDITGHPAPFPELLAERHILTWSNPKSIVLDPFMGSGTTAVIARSLDRHFVGSEINPIYVKLAQERLAKPWQPALPMFA